MRLSVLRRRRWSIQLVREAGADCEAIDTRLPVRDRTRETPRETNGRASNNRPRLQRRSRQLTGSRLKHKKTAYAQRLSNLTKSKPKGREIQGGVRTEITDLSPVAGSSTGPNRRLSDAITKANRSQSAGKGSHRRGESLHFHCKSSRKLVPARLPAVTTLVSRSICSKSRA